MPKMIAKKARKVSIITLFLLLFSTLLADEYPFRDITKPIIQLPQEVCILQASPYRTGSTLMTGILIYLFEDQPFVKYPFESFNHKVVKTHRPSFYTRMYSRDVYVVSTIRNPLDAFTSWAYVQTPKDGDNKLVLDQKNVEDYANLTFNCFRSFFQFYPTVPKERLLILNYEIFINDFDYICDNLESLFKIVIDEEVRANIKSIFNIENMEKVAAQYPTFNQSDLYTGIHGNHINKVNWREDIPEEYHEYLLQKFEPLFTQFASLLQAEE